MISIVIPAYNEEKRLYDNIQEIIKVVSEYEYELIIVDDGSKDATWSIIKKLNEENSNIKGCRFSRNFGKESALCAGVAYAKGDAVITMDSDLQHPPKCIPEMISAWKNGCKIVEALREKRPKESLKYKLCANTFYNILNKFTKFNLKNATDFKLMDRQVVNDINSLQEGNVFFRGLVEWVGYEKHKIYFKPEQRKGDTSKFNTKSLTKLAINAITSFSSSLLYITIILSIVFFIGALILGIQTIINKIVGNALSGFTTVIILQLITGAAILFCLGIIGVYIAKIYDEVKRRPRYIISEKI